MPARPSLATKATGQMELLGEYPGVFNIHLLPDVLLVNWYGLSSLQSTPQFEALCAECSRRFARQQVSCVQLLTAKISRLPDAETRDELTRINQMYDSMVACCAVLIPVQGFVGSAIRGLVTAISLKTRRNHANLKIVGTPESAVEWLVPAHHAATNREIDPQPLVAALHQLLAQH